VHDAGNAAAVLGLDDEHVAAVPLGDHLLLQVFRRLLAAEVRLERGAQPRSLFPQAVAQQFQLRARIVDDVAGRVDLGADLRHLVPERLRASAGRVEKGERTGHAAKQGARFVNRFEKRGELDEPCRFERPALDGERGERARQIDSRSQWKRSVRLDEPRRLARLCEQLRHAMRVSRRRQPRQPLGAHRRQRERLDSVDDAIEFECAERAWLHGRYGRDAAGS